MPSSGTRWSTNAIFSNSWQLANQPSVHPTAFPFFEEGVTTTRNFHPWFNTGCNPSANVVWFASIIITHLYNKGIQLQQCSFPELYYTTTCSNRDITFSFHPLALHHVHHSFQTLLNSLHPKLYAQCNLHQTTNYMRTAYSHNCNVQHVQHHTMCYQSVTFSTKSYVQTQRQPSALKTNQSSVKEHPTLCSVFVATEWDMCSYHSDLCILHTDKHAYIGHYFIWTIFTDGAANTCMSHLINLLFIACHNSGSEITDITFWLNIPGFESWQSKRFFSSPTF